MDTINFLVEGHHHVVNTLFKKLIFVLKVGVESATIDECSVTNVNDCDCGKMLFFKQFIEGVYDGFLSALNSKVCFFIHNTTCLSCILADIHTPVNIVFYFIKG